MLRTRGVLEELGEKGILGGGEDILYEIWHEGMVNRCCTVHILKRPSPHGERPMERMGSPHLHAH